MRKEKLLFVVLFSIVVIFNACNSGSQNMDTQKEQIVYKAFDAFAQGNTDAMDSLCSTDYVEHQIDTAHSPLRGRAATNEATKSYHKAMPDMKIVVNSIAVSNDTVLAYDILSGTMTDTLMGIPPSNKQVSLTGADIFVVKNSKITEHWGFVDVNDMAQFAPPKEMPTDKTMKKKK
jgi:steroid delta-isomerase-like uncharacterized protein